jgi:hypothetical protein
VSGSAHGSIHINAIMDRNKISDDFMNKDWFVGIFQA